MDILNDLLDSFKTYLDKGVEYAPKVFLGLGVLIIGWIIAKILAAVAHRTLKAVKFDDLMAKVGMDKILGRIKPGLSLARILSKTLYWLLMLVFITAACDVWGLQMVTDGIGAFFEYLPTLLIALIIFVIGAYIADLIKNMVYTAANSIGVSGSKTIANIVYYVLFIFIAITALNQAGIDTDIITSNVTLILGAILLAFAISYGFAARNLVGNLLSSYYGKGKYHMGQKIRVGDVEGEIVKIDSISITLQTSDSKIVLPSKTLVEEKIEILDDGESDD